jgi:hypothetical protein
MQADLATAQLHSTQARKHLAQTIATDLQGNNLATNIAANWSRKPTHKKHQKIDDVQVSYADPVGASAIPALAGPAEACRKLSENAVRLDVLVVIKAIVRVGKAAKAVTAN